MKPGLDLSALTCVCGLSVAAHRIGGAQISCAEALDRAFIVGDQVPQPHERLHAIAAEVHRLDRHAEVVAGGADGRIEWVRA